MKRAFSLVELSIVILIIGVLIAGIGQGIELVQDARLSSARMLTQSSRVNSLKGLILWLEPTSEASFSSTETSDNSTVSSWNDINPQATVRNNATQTGASSIKPIYIEKGINNLPILRFDGVAQYLNYDGSALVNSDYTIFVVEKITNLSSKGYFLAGIDSTANARLHIGYRPDSNNKITQAHYGNGNDLDYTPPSYVMAPAMHSFWFSTSGGKKYWNNGGVTPEASASTASQSAALVSYNGAKIALNGTTECYKGDIAEIIIFSRALSDKDRQAVESYLSKKWAIKIS
jgi:prepilin-type N-terminal cleavage/methylation domain-containing protein